MRISNSMRWLVVVAGAIMLLAVAAACSSETIEVPGETVVVKEEVIKTVEVPGETVVKEVIKEVQVPGETVVVKEEVVKEVMVPGETVVVEKVVTETVEVPGETVTVEVVKTVEVPGETVVVEKEVVKTVEVPGQTVVVEKEVVKTVEVPGQTVVVKEEVVKTVEVPGPERVVVKEVPAGYVIDPTTGKPVLKPQYGGTITIVATKEPDNIDPYVSYTAGFAISGINEKLGFTDWAIDRDVFDYSTISTPEVALTGQLAESWEQTDPTTYVFHIRKGVYWHNKPPMNGRELTADDIKYNFDRIFGLGEFSEADLADPTHLPVERYNIESIETTDKYTVVFKLKSITLTALSAILVGENAYILAPEAVEQYGDVADWRNVVGTGPFMWTDNVEGSSATYTKNPDYWGYDEKYPENRLPYIDKLRRLISKEKATQLALMRTGKVDMIGYWGGALRTVDAAVSLQRTNPELNLWPYSFRSETAFAMNTQKAPFNDIRVRHAMQMAIDLETINKTYFHGWGIITPTGHQGMGLIGNIFPFEEWPEEIKQYHRYDPEGAEKLLDEAGYPRGADGIRFKTVHEHMDYFDLDYFQIAIEYLGAIGIDVEVKLNDRAAHLASIREHKQLGLINGTHNADYPGLIALSQAWSKAGYNESNVSDPVYDEMYEAAVAATTIEEQMRLRIEADRYSIEKHWWIGGVRVPSFNVSQPWIIGYNGEIDGTIDPLQKFARLWIDSELKEAMGY